jgi:ABC-type transporter Mla MlaB component
VDLPPLLLDGNLQALMGVLAFVRDAPDQIVELDATKVVAIEPTAACLLAASARGAEVRGRAIVIRGMNTRLVPTLAEFGASLRFLDSREEGIHAAAIPTTVVRYVAAASDANNAANAMAAYLARFIPREDEAQMQQDRYGLRIHHAIQPALAYVLTELVDNVFSHAASEDFRDPKAWMAVQSYPAGDLVRVAVVDDGCGLLASLRGLVVDAPKNHYDAITRAFEPFVSSKSSPGLYAERRHMGLGLAVCRAICQRLGGRIVAATGNAWIENPGLPGRIRRAIDSPYRGTLIALELNRRGVTTGLLQEVLDRLAGTPDLRLRFD